MPRRLRVLVSAYACNPYRGSEQGVGWGWANAATRNHDVWVLTAEHNRADIEKAVAAQPKRYRSMRFHYIPRTRWRALEKVWKPAYLWTYELWQREAYRAGLELHRKVRFDLAHLVTYVTFRSPGHLWKLGIPFVWGPIGALQNTPWRLLPMMGLKGCVHFAGRNVINSLHKAFLPGPKQAFRQAVTVIAATEGVRRQIKRWYGRDSEVICEIGAPSVIASNFTRREPREPLRLAWSGLHQAGKGLPLLLGALPALNPHVQWTLDILGAGGCTSMWRRVAGKLGLDGRCRWHGWVPREAAISVVSRAHVFVITSLKELTSSVLLEALSQGVPASRYPFTAGASSSPTWRRRSSGSRRTSRSGSDSPPALCAAAATSRGRGKLKD